MSHNTQTRNNWFYLFGTNLVGVMNDNFMKHCIIFIAVSWNLPDWMSQSQLIAAVSGALVLPYILLSPISGNITHKWKKTDILRTMKIIEIGIVILAAIAFFNQWIYLAILSVLIMGIQSCLYSPSKYGIIRDIDGEKGAAQGSGIFEMMAFLGILIGTLAASLSADFYTPWLVSVIMITLAALGIILSFNIKIKETETDDNIISNNPITFIRESAKYAKQFPGLNAAVYGASALWLIGGMLQMNLVLHCTSTMGWSNTTSGIILSSAAIGIALGCVVAGKMTDRVKNPINLIIYALIGMIILMATVSLWQMPKTLLGVCIFTTAFLGGMFQVPNLSKIQRAPIGKNLGNVLAYTNLITFILVLVGTALFSIVSELTDENSYAVFAAIAVICSLVLAAFIILKVKLKEQLYK